MGGIVEMNFNILWGEKIYNLFFFFLEHLVLSNIYQVKNQRGFLSYSIISQIFLPIFIVTKKSMVEKDFKIVK